MKTASELLTDFRALQAIRYPYESTFQDITYLVIPNRPRFYFTTPLYTPDIDIYDSTAIQANAELAATLSSGLVNPQQQWFRLKAKKNVKYPVETTQLYLEDRASQMYDMLGSPTTGFYSTINEAFLDLTAYGTACIEVYYDFKDDTIKYRPFHLSSLYISTNSSGVVDTVYIKTRYTARQAAQQFGLANLPAGYQTMVSAAPHDKFDVIRAVVPEESYIKKVRDQQTYYSAYFTDSGEIISEGHLKSFPYVVPRWAKVTGEDYGRSAAWTVLPHIKMAQSFGLDLLTVSQKKADPPLLMPDDGVYLPVNANAGGPIMGGMDSTTNQVRMAYLQNTGDLQALNQVIEQQQTIIKNAFYSNSLSSRQGPQMTAEEVIALKEEALRNMGPNAVRVTQEGLAPLIERTYELMVEHDKFDKPDPQLFQGTPKIDISVEFTSPLAQTAKAQDSISISKFMSQGLMPLLQLDPQITDAVNYNRILSVLGTGYGVPEKIFNTPQELQAAQQARQQQQQMQMKMQLADQADKHNAAMIKAKGPQQSPGMDING